MKCVFSGPKRLGRRMSHPYRHAMPVEPIFVQMGARGHHFSEVNAGAGKMESLPNPGVECHPRAKIRLVRLRARCGRPPP